MPSLYVAFNTKKSEKHFHPMLGVLYSHMGYCHLCIIGWFFLPQGSQLDVSAYVKFEQMNLYNKINFCILSNLYGVMTANRTAHCFTVYSGFFMV